jgi:hypothetical protein
MFSDKNYDPAVKAFMKRAAKNLRKAASTNDSAVMWAVIYQLQSVIDGYEAAAHQIAMPEDR